MEDYIGKTSLHQYLVIEEATAMFVKISGGFSKATTVSLRTQVGAVYAQTRLISNEMFEAFGNPVISTKKTDNTNTDPVINISREFVPNVKSSNSATKSEVSSLKDIFNKSLNDLSASDAYQVEDGSKNWSESFHGLGNAPFSKEAQDILYSELPENDIEITPDGLLYLPEIKYRRILNRAFGAGAWGLAPRSETLVQMQETGGLLTREYGLVIHGRLVSIARGEQTFFKESGIPTATEGCKSNALMRCCKDLGIASELWDPRFIKQFKKKNCENIFVEHVVTRKKKKIWKRKDEDVEYPYKK